ncbi:hypothetical protein A3K34_02990 [candidate division WWE3 bacterium RIFOXYC1_FULL_40_10]|uniref:DUF6311 domain-containing protein n=1 Tax=candidate division WWE3 bacterium RIFOXYA2_FULL_46_9 TaxID=1802636 RepID=A0A1F4W099_UNCKA|nr:MAG: hypothetical protein A3K58_02990 [candidate division WWE3 bacterium RIFOXYB1_FULL_40_22]OGC61813.1 MAG: hypothetical protein A3K37_02990 [candidate division WWE3 bacterium RIFOXYA1_FULL_40_11]OGC62831.1 MAG: hypothetical protein A2264_04150 [candidate division WWE3 bacterium RIFOXYA2_FULL_46_9]OGC64285.1 MAG: hypothetical protein A2326_00405 [candidate division WWE3 bacterium RIFOXYB2_FULL_41_6]OGC66196.1 MAG: hypothetical protein A3K34_02990 [candidate division WWE3 bacterium RIFOXYC1_
MLKLLSNVILGIIEDNTGLFSYPRVYDVLANIKLPLVAYPHDFIHLTYQSSQPIIWTLYFFLAKYIDVVFLYNLWIILSFVLTLIFSYIFIKIFVKNKPISLLVSLVFTFSPYFYYSSRNHLDLMQFWLLILFLIMFFGKNYRYKPLLLGFLAAVTLGVSNYIAYILLLFVGLHFVYSLDFLDSKKVCKFFAFMLSFLVFGLFILSPYLSLVRQGSSSAFPPSRTFEDFVTFSSKPWLFFLPPVDNPIFGSLSTHVINTLAEKWGYFWTANYFKSEHSTNYMGIVNSVFAVIGLVSLKKYSYEERKPFYILALIIISLALLSLPPVATVFGINLYLPSFLLFKVFPMFRVLSRLNVLSLLLALIFTGLGYTRLIAKYGKSKSTYLCISFLFVLSLCEFFVPFKGVDVSSPPEVYSFLKELPGGPMAVYPYSKANEALYWLSEYNKPLMNPRNYASTDGAFTSEKFTKNLASEKGLLEFEELGGTYIVYFYNADKDPVNASKFFDSNSLLEKVIVMDHTAPDLKLINPFISIADASSTYSNSAIIYRFKR